MKKIISLLLVLCVSFGCLAGCTTRASLYTDEYVVDQVAKHWPNVDFISVERGFIKDYDLIDEENVEAKIYNFKNKDFSFDFAARTIIFDGRQGAWPRLHRKATFFI